jgi:tetratricopeptide (TPR) repeat protein
LHALASEPPLAPVSSLFMKENFKILICILFLAGAISICAQPQKLTKDQLVEKSNALFESGKQKDAIDLINEYPEFADEVDVLYVKSVAYTELRDYKNADIAYQKGFDIFLKNAGESLSIANEYAAKPTPTKEEKEIAAMMYSAAMISFASADLTNALRSVAFGKNGMPEDKREPKNLVGYEDFRKTYEETAIKSGELNLKNNQLKDALADFSKAIELNPKNPASYIGRAKVYRKLKKIKLAMADEANARKYSLKK